MAMLTLCSSCGQAQTKSEMTKENKHYSTTSEEKLKVTDEEWKSILDPGVYRIARQSGTEYAYSGKYDKHFETGEYHCKVCGNKLFSSDTKFNSGCGWPAFFEAASETSMKYIEDNTHGMQRVEVRCGRCDSHLGHVFNDGPPPTGKRYCINSLVIQFEEDEKE